jgi:hypothetical protein
MDWNSFNRELQNRVSDPGMRYILGMIYERVLDTAKQQDEVASLCLEMSKALSSFVVVNEVLEDKVKHLQKTVSGERAGVELRSVPLTNE